MRSCRCLTTARLPGQGWAVVCDKWACCSDAAANEQKFHPLLRSPDAACVSSWNVLAGVCMLQKSHQAGAGRGTAVLHVSNVAY